MTPAQLRALLGAATKRPWAADAEGRGTLQPASEPKPAPLLGEIHEIQRIEAILKGGSTPPASGSTPATQKDRQ